MQTLLGFVICLVLLSTGSALECEVCRAVARNCTGTRQTCGAGKDTCAIVLSVNSLESESQKPFLKDPIYTISKGCGSSSDCRTSPKYLTIAPGRELRSSITCCVGNACKTVNPQWPPAITRTNGKRCPSCYTNSIGTVKRCNNGETVNCVGPEDKCLDLEMTLTFGKLIIKNIQKGCATQSVCDDFRRRSSGASQVGITVNKLECKTAPNASS